MLIIVFALSLVPSILIYLMLKNRKPQDIEYKKICTSALRRGAFPGAVFVILFSAVLYIFEIVLKLLGANAVIVSMYQDFILAALSEELVKYMLLKRLLKKTNYPYTQTDIVSWMMLIGMGFGILEAFWYAIGANAGMMLTRGICAMHCGYGFIMGYFVSRGMQTGKKKYTICGILLPFLLHGLYDFCLSDTLTQISEDFAYVSLALAIIAIITLIIAIIYIKKDRKQAAYE